jgi:TldD protein
MNSLTTATRTLLEPAGLNADGLATELSRMLTHSVDLADIYFQSTRTQSWSLEDGIVKEGAFSIDHGIGVRAVSGDKTGFAYSDQINPRALTDASAAVRAIGRQGGDQDIVVWQAAPANLRYQGNDPLVGVKASTAVDLLQRLDQAARQRDPRIQQVMLGLTSSHSTVLVAASDGTLSADIRPLIRLNVRVVAEQGGRRETGSAGGGGRVGYDFLLADDRALAYVDEAVRQALVNLEADAAPAGTMLHEAIGHGLEGDFNRKGTSAFSGRIGQRIASSACTVVDDGTLVNRRGSLNVDDEGTPSQCTTLIEDGVLKGYLQDKHNAKLTGSRSTGNGRRQSYAHRPLPRMTNTYMLAGKQEPEEIIASVSKGLYAVNFGGGQVDITNGKFVFSASEAYLIENGKIGPPVRGATLIGNGPDVLTRVSMVGNDLRLDDGIGTCGKDGQSVPVGVGQPTLRVDALTVGGTRTDTST